MRSSDSPLFEQFRKSAFQVKRTKKNLGRSPEDLTLEQTVNADAANTMTVISHFTNSVPGRQRCALSYDIRTTVISTLLKKIGITKKDDTSYELHTSLVGEMSSKSLKPSKKNNSFDVNITIISHYIRQLFHIISGRAASSDVANFFLNANDVGRNQKKIFYLDVRKCGSFHGTTQTKHDFEFRI